jgi:hypothetical protein
MELGGLGANMARCGVLHTLISTQIPTSCLQHLVARNIDPRYHEHYHVLVMCNRTSNAWRTTMITGQMGNPTRPHYT